MTKKIWTVYDPTRSQIQAYGDKKQAHGRQNEILEEFRQSKIDAAPVLQEWIISNGNTSECWIIIAGGLLGLFGTESDAKQAREGFENNPSKLLPLASSQIEVHKLHIKTSPYVEAHQIAGIFKNYSTIAGSAAEFELRTRLLADKTPELKPFSVKDKLSDLEDRIINHFDAVLSEEDVKFRHGSK